ncbi:hypothetical protein BDY19DRAFT_911986 [Irpex rosettiformis]|uniref:Uncharacterized protein n=1 Tax=Irpex rosettiformis TaxID=378272 RepID=A0ACB8UIQ2_9APHY|nr:hypothetical protein BDY19DRAFT_911986 [Irpex rosettiformis]
MHLFNSLVPVLVFACIATAAPHAISNFDSSLGITRRNVPPAGSDLFNPGTLSHPWTPVTNIVEEFVKDETGKKTPSGPVAAF